MKANDISQLPFEAKEIGNGKGKGLIASRDIEAGEVIVTEEPLLVVHSSDNEDILEELVDATKEVKARIMKLSDLGDADLGCTEFFSALESENATKELEVLMRKFRSNMLHAPGEVDDDSCAVYDTICLINHSCSPNALWVDHEDGERLEVRACQRIKKGQEILASYYTFSEFPSREERMALIQEDRYFQCRCDLCSLSGEALKKDESIRFQIRELSAAIENEGDTLEALRKAEVKLDLMEKLENRLTLRFPHHLLTCYTLARQLEDMEKASTFKERILTLAKILGHYYHNYFMDLLS